LTGEHSVAARAASLIAVAEDLAGEFSLRPLLERILRRCTELLGCDAGSICSVDEAAGTYRKEADIGVACQSGRVFPLTEGMTGAVVARRGPVWFARYDDVPGGHIAGEARATLRGVIGVPLEWRGRIIGVCIVFSRDERRVFGPDDAELLELFAKHAAIALENARMHEVAEERVRAEAAAAERDRLLGEVHDSLAQRLVSVRVHLDSAERDLAAIATRPPAGSAGDDRASAGQDGIGVVAEHLRQAGTAARDALAEARLTLLGLAASPLDGRTLDAASTGSAAPRSASCTCSTGTHTNCWRSAGSTSAGTTSGTTAPRSTWRARPSRSAASTRRSRDCSPPRRRSRSGPSDGPASRASAAVASARGREGAAALQRSELCGRGTQGGFSWARRLASGGC
jgi:GAF domain-containing protein